MDKVPEKRGIREVQVRLVFGEHFLPFVWFREFPSVGCLYNDRFFSRELVITIHEACWMMLHKLPCGNRMITKPIALIEEFVSRVLRTIAMFTSLNLDIFNLYALSQLLCEALLLLLNAKDDSLVDCSEAVLHGFNENEELRHEGGVLPRFPVNMLVERFGLVATCSNTFSSKQGPWLYSFFAYVVNIPGVLGAILLEMATEVIFELLDQFLINEPVIHEGGQITCKLRNSGQKFILGQSTQEGLDEPIASSRCRWHIYSCSPSCSAKL